MKKILSIVTTVIVFCAENVVAQGTEKSKLFEQQDPNGFAMAITAMSVVFSALMLLFLVFKCIGVVMNKEKKPKTTNTENLTEQNPAIVGGGNNTNGAALNGEEIAAIALALSMYDDDMHDIESNVVTINKVARAYSPWSSKIYSLRQIPNKK